MEKFKIAVIAGDGIGPEVIAEGKKVLSGIAALDGTFAVEFTDFPWGCEYYLKTGEMMLRTASIRSRRSMQSTSVLSAIRAFQTMSRWGSCS